MNDIEIALRRDLQDAEYAEAYAESFLNAFIATQIKVIREQRELTQAQLAERIGTTQAGVSRVEDVDYSSWSVKTLKKIAAALEVRLRVSLEPYGTLPDEVLNFTRDHLERVERSNDPGLGDFSEHRIQETARDLSILTRIAIAQQKISDIGAYREAGTQATPLDREPQKLRGGDKAYANSSY